MYRNTYATINLDSIATNIKNIGQNIGKSQVIAVVKADAYGHGMFEVASAALNAGAKTLAVAMCEEGAALRLEVKEAPIIVLGLSNKNQMFLGVTTDLSMCVASAEDILQIEEIAKLNNKKASIQLKIDTGMCRIGIRKLKELSEVTDALRACKNVVLDGIFTHFACSDEANKEFTHNQHKKFMEFVAGLNKEGFYPKVHCCNSAAAIDLPEFAYDYIRFGISMYGYYPSKNVCHGDVELIPAMEVVAEVSHIKYVDAGESIGYGATYTAKSKMKIATVQIGYGDGYNRLLSGKGKMLVKDGDNYVFANIVGRVCMDQTMIDVTHIKNISAGDIVVVMGKRDNITFTAEEIAKICGTISYEIVLSYTNRVPRVYIRN